MEERARSPCPPPSGGFQCLPNLGVPRPPPQAQPWALVTPLGPRVMLSPAWPGPAQAAVLRAVQAVCGLTGIQGPVQRQLPVPLKGESGV